MAKYLDLSANLSVSMTEVLGAKRTNETPPEKEEEDRADG